MASIRFPVQFAQQSTCPSTKLQQHKMQLAGMWPFQSWSYLYLDDRITRSVLCACLRDLCCLVSLVLLCSWQALGFSATIRRCTTKLAWGQRTAWQDARQNKCSRWPMSHVMYAEQHWGAPNLEVSATRLLHWFTDGKEGGRHGKTDAMDSPWNQSFFSNLPLTTPSLACILPSFLLSVELFFSQLFS